MIDALNFMFVFAGIPLVFGMLGLVAKIPLRVLQPAGLAVLGGEAAILLYLASRPDSGPAFMILPVAVLITGFCAVLGLRRTSAASGTSLASVMIVTGLSLGVLLTPTPVSRLFLIGVLCYAAMSCRQAGERTMQKIIRLAQLGVAVILSFTALLVTDAFDSTAGLFLAVTFVPLVPFHLPFVSIVSSTERTLSSVWLVGWLSIGLAELQRWQPLVPETMLAACQILAFVSALYASLKCLGENQTRLFLGYAAIAQTALLWGLAAILSDFSRWGIPFGIVVAFVMSGLLLSYSFIQHRYGRHVLGTLPGLALPMPHLGKLFVLLISIAMLLPLVPVILGFRNGAVMIRQDEPLAMLLATFFITWIFSSWYMTNLLQHTVFGEARPDLAYSDLKPSEIFSLTLLIIGATYGVLLH